MQSVIMYEQVKSLYAELGIDTEQALEVLTSTPISLHCWQSDDVGGFEAGGTELGSGLAVTGNYPGKARSIDELRQDLEQVLSLLPGNHRLNLHAMYGDFGGKQVDRDAIEVEHFQSWIDWCKSNNMGMDFNPSFEEFVDNCNLVSLGDPALTIVLEFLDGKVLMSALKTVADLTWEEFASKLGEQRLKELFSDVDILGLGYWSLTPDFDNLLDGFISRYDRGNAPRRMFFDFADINKKSKQSFTETTRLMGRLNEKIPMTISFNEHEGKELFSRFSLEMHDEPEIVASDLTSLREKMGIDELIVHTPHFAAASHSTDGEAYALQEHQSEVIRTAGAGDTFNVGYLSASLGNLPIKERLVIANAATAYFVTHATAPDKEQLIAQIEAATDK